MTLRPAALAIWITVAPTGPDAYQAVSMISLYLIASEAYLHPQTRTQCHPSGELRTLSTRGALSALQSQIIVRTNDKRDGLE